MNAGVEIAVTQERFSGNTRKHYADLRNSALVLQYSRCFTTQERAYTQHQLHTQKPQQYFIDFSEKPELEVSVKWKKSPKTEVTFASNLSNHVLQLAWRPHIIFRVNMKSNAEATRFSSPSSIGQCGRRPNILSNDVLHITTLRSCGWHQAQTFTIKG